MKSIKLTRSMSLDEAFVEAKCVPGDELEIFGGTSQFHLTAGRPRVSYLRLTQCICKVGDGSFYVGHPALQTKVDIEGCRIEGNGPESAKTDVFSSVYLNAVEKTVWKDTLNGPVNALGVYDSNIINVRSDALSGCVSVSNVRVNSVVGGGGSHPDLHQIYMPTLTKGLKIILNSTRGWDLNGQGLHWTVTNDFPIDADLSLVYIPWRTPGQVWQSRITCPIDNFIARGCVFGQPLRFAPSKISGKVAFVDCDFDSLIVTSEEDKATLDKCEFIRCTVRTPSTVQGTYIPAGVVLVQ